MVDPHRLRAVKAVVASVSIQTAAMLPAFLTGALAVQLRDALGLSESRLGVAVALFFLVAAVMSPHAGVLSDHLGPRRSLSIAGCLSAVSLLGCAIFVRNYPTLLALLAIGSVGLAIAGPGTKVMVAQGVPRRRHGLAFGVQAGSVPFSAFLSGLMVPLVALPLGWRWAYGAVALLPALGLALAPPIGAAAGPVERVNGRRLGDIDYHPLVMLALAAALGSAAATTLAAFFVSAATETGVDEGLAGALLSLGSASVIAGRIYAGLSADRKGTDPLRAVASLMAISTAGYLVTASDSKWLMPVGALFALAAGWSWSGLIVHAVVRHYAAAPGAATGMISGGLNVGGVVGPVAFGQLVAHFSYAVAFLATALSTLLGSIAAAAGRRRLEASSPASEARTTGAPPTVANPGS
jgi:MFS family permease